MATNTAKKQETKVEQPTAQNVTNLADFSNQKMEKKIAKLQAEKAEIIKTAATNQASMDEIHNLILTMVRARSFAELNSALQSRLKTNLNVDAVRMLLITDIAKLSDKPNNTITTAEIEAAFPHEENKKVQLRTLYHDEARAIHGNHAPTINSDALMLLTTQDGEDLGVLALGSTDQTHFHAGQGAELLNFLAGVLTSCVEKLRHDAN